MQGGHQVQRLRDRGYLVEAQVQSLQEMPGVQYHFVLNQAGGHFNAPGLRVRRIGGGSGV